MKRTNRSSGLWGQHLTEGPKMRPSHQIRIVHTLSEKLLIILFFCLKPQLFCWASDERKDNPLPHTTIVSCRIIRVNREILGKIGNRKISLLFRFVERQTSTFCHINCTKLIGSYPQYPQVIHIIEPSYPVLLNFS